MSLPEIFEKRPVVCTTGEDSCDELTAASSRSWLRIAIAGVFAGQGMVFSLAVNMTPPIYGSIGYWIVHSGLAVSSLLVAFFLGGPLFRSTWGMIRAARLSIEGLFTLSLVGAFIGSLVSSIIGEGGVYYEVVSVVIAIYTIGRMVGERAHGRVGVESERLRECFDSVAIIDEVGSVTRMPVSEILEGNLVRIEAGEAVSVDGIIRKGVGFIRETALTGEPSAVVRSVGDSVRAGTWSIDGVFEIEVTAGEGARELDRILEAVEEGAGNPSELQTQANEMIQGFLPLVVGVSLATAIYWGFMGTWVQSILYSMSVLLVACPCALGLATPVAVWQGLFELAKIGIVSRDGALLDVLAQTRRIFFDKTGTLSEEQMKVVEVKVLPKWESRRNELLRAVFLIEGQVDHPIGSSLVTGLEEAVHSNSTVSVESLELVSALGVKAQVSWGADFTACLKIGELKFVESSFDEIDLAIEQLSVVDGRRIFLFVDDVLAVIFVLKEQLRSGVESVWDELGAMKIEASIVTGDSRPTIEFPQSVEVCAGMSAEEKAIRIQQERSEGMYPLFVGDGINDAAAMVEASGSIAMESATGLARSSASGEFTADRIEALPPAIRLARCVRQRLRGNLKYAAFYNVIGMGLAAAGMLHPIAAAIIMLVSSLFVTLRALRPYY